MALPVGMSRSTSQPSPLSYHQRNLPTHPHAYSYCCGPPQHQQRQRHYSEVPTPVIKMESQSPDQLARAHYLGYQPGGGYRGDWTATMTPPTAQYPIRLLSRVPGHRRVQAAAPAAASAEGFHGYYSTNNAFLDAENLRRSNVSRQSEVSHTSHSEAQHLALNGRKRTHPQNFPPNPQGNHNQTNLEGTHYALPRHSGKDQYIASNSSSSTHLSFPEYFEHPNSAMSLSYETAQQFMTDANYPRMHDPQEQEEIHHEHPRYPSPPMPSADMDPYSHQGLDAAANVIENLPQLQGNDADPPSPGRSKPIPKPRRDVTKGENGRYVCTWVGCTEEVRDFGRKCEWSKHMDKHDRPYKCPAEGCEKLPGFTYSGGLLRHEREVHGKHGGPRKQLNCPHLNCKRHTGKGFSRQENLNEHLRRVHTSDGVIPDGAETEEDGEDSKAGMKRKRRGHGSGGGGGDDIREELKRLRSENEELRRHSEAQTAQTNEMMAQIRQLQSAVTVAHPRMPNAPMM